MGGRKRERDIQREIQRETENKGQRREKQNRKTEKERERKHESTGILSWCFIQIGSMNKVKVVYWRKDNLPIHKTLEKNDCTATPSNP